ncbi:ABC transporter ATP-binding protein [Leucobacter sp. CSA2]|uniref:ABC transporter ATP-binding protein n=1 Tax=Leucobacter edaphi TaxID=2796472 RepID=A0A934QE19_9MICO|nr:ABC transporter ATP-binding protein [Leucobacter edaphi]MBK0421554.1 ABC transporter ATP-binding protein [Leucobacter edaphi]
MTDMILQASSLTHRFGATRALDRTSLNIVEGTSTAIMGASGSGKTTLLHMLAGILTPDEGTIQYGGRDITQMSDRDRSRLRREEFGFVFQQGLLIPELTAIENVALALMLTGTPRAKALGPAAQWLASLGLAGMEDRRIGQLSGGQAQRVAIARAQITGARVIFADEPTGALDSETSREVMDALIGSTVANGRTLVLVTHDPNVAARCTRTVLMQDGRIMPGAAAASEVTGREITQTGPNPIVPGPAAAPGAAAHPSPPSATAPAPASAHVNAQANTATGVER